MFTTSCFVRISRLEERESIAKRLRDIGYKRDPNSRNRNNPYFITHPTHPNGPVFEQTNGYIAGFQKLEPRSVDCGDNEDLFLALAALRGDSDYMQWFTDESNYYWEKCPSEKADITAFEGYYHTKGHKATPEELITHFKKEK